jgi:hypothetical protein
MTICEDCKQKDADCPFIGNSCKHDQSPKSVVIGAVPFAIVLFLLLIVVFIMLYGG